ncbi:expressed unknown protein [Seminavis robusta]|uniref:SAP domain-containing protein n=1 Tax=Seminavis robusta TaxID=568900 RepID=A0A9N8ENC0_9STRA|nr:expressed unknown protein [Seminavis robusta]|eukprot:Sro1420_g271160.2  (298) ;mRNA; f:26364-27257
MDVYPRISDMSYRELQRACKDAGLPAIGKTAVLQKHLDDYRKNPRKALKRLAASKEKNKTGFIDWENSAAKEILLKDLEPEGRLYGNSLEAKDVFDDYTERYKYIFCDVPFSQFKAKYNETIKKAEAAQRRARSAQEEAWMKHDSRLYPRQTHNHRGEPIFDVDIEAKETLHYDIKHELHKRMTPKELWQYREVYSKYKLDTFRQRIYQYQKQVKCLNKPEKKPKEKDEFAAKRTPKERNQKDELAAKRTPKERKERDELAAKRTQKEVTSSKMKEGNRQRKQSRSKKRHGGPIHLG